MRHLVICAVASLLCAGPAYAEKWVEIGEWLEYDADSATYDSADDVVVVYIADWGWEDEGWEAFSCASDGAWWWSEKDKSWKSYTLDRADEEDADYGLLRDRLCGMKASLPYRDF